MTETATPTKWVQPDIPSKWDIIPIHNSDRAAFRSCRRRWDYSSPSRNNLTIRADIHGIYIPWFFGTGIHYSLEQYYSPILRRDPVEAWKTWFDIMWRGGTVSEEWLDKVYDLKPQPILTQPPVTATGDSPTEEQTETWLENSVLWKVKGLEDILPDPDHAEWDELFELGVGMMEYYKGYAEVNDDFTVVVAEHDFSVPIWDFENDKILERIDIREESPNFGKVLEVHARGRQDELYIKPNGKMGILENKTAGKWGEDELRKLESDEQTTHYLWSAEIEAQYYDLPHKGEPLEEVTYNVLRKAFPREPTMLKSGMFSTDRQNESTTYDLLTDWIAKNMPGIPLNEKQKGYLEYLRDVGDENFIVRKPVRRNRHQLRNAGYRLYLETLDMLDPKVRIYPNISNDYSCLNCAFRAPCMAEEDGSDFKQLVADNYTINKDR